MIDQLILYDQAMLTWMQTNLASLLPGRTTQILISTPRKAFAEVTSGVLVNERTLTTPRIALQRLYTNNAPKRFNASRLRALGWSNDSSNEKRSLLSSKFPAPIDIHYQVDLWSRFYKEINLWERQLLESFASQYIYLRIRPNDMFGWKSYIVFLDGQISNNSDLEPEEGERIIRKTLMLRAECWIFPDVFVPNYVVKRVKTIYEDTEGDWSDLSFMPPEETLATGNGTSVSFSGTLERKPIVQHTPVIQTVIGSTVKIVSDNGSGGWVGDSVVSGALDYTTGVYSIVFSAAPNSGEPITITYFTVSLS